MIQISSIEKLDFKKHNISTFDYCKQLRRLTRGKSTEN